MKKFIFFICIFLLIWYCPVFSIAQQVTEDPSDNILELTKLAKKGDVKAQNDLGVCYDNGEGIRRDYVQAVFWYKKAAKQGDATAQYNLGNCYYYGKGVMKDNYWAVFWYKKAAEQGDATAQYNLGNCYYDGKGGSKDYAQAMEWYTKAAEQGNADSQKKLGFCYYNGEGVTKDFNQAASWLKKASEQGDADSQNRLGFCYYNGEGVAKDFTQAVYWFTKAAEQDVVESQSRLGYCYYNGEGVAKDFTQAVSWFTKAAEQGDADSQNRLGVCYYNGEGVTKDFNQAVSWFTKAAEQGDADSQNRLGFCYYNGEGVTKDFNQAVSWYKKAIKQGDVTALYNLGNCYYYGKGVKKDYNQALELYIKAAEQGNNNAKENLANIEKEMEAENTSTLSLAKTSSTKTLINRVLGSTRKVSTPQYQHDNNIAANPNTTITMNSSPTPSNSDNTRAISAVDQNIYVNKNTDNNTFVVVIGNEKYADEADVPYAENDARIFREYCQKTLGVDERHIRLIINATYNDFRKAISWLKQGMDVYNGQGRVIFYYAGHGIPNEADKSTYLLPVDGIGNDMESAYPLNKLYQALGELQAQTVTVFLDACFSGAKRDGQMMASARGVAIKAKPGTPKGKMVIFSAASGDETAYPFKSQQHGLFTYYLLKKLQETRGKVTLGDLSDYLTREVRRESFDENNKIQTPTVNASTSLQGAWRDLNLSK